MEQQVLVDEDEGRGPCKDPASALPHNDILSKASTGAQASSSRQYGATLIEIVLYLAVAAVLVFAVFGLFGMAFGSAKTKTEQTNVQGLISGIQNLYGATRDFPNGDMNALLISTKAAPSGIISAGTLRNSWGAGISVTGNGNTYTITDAGIPKSACVELAQLPVDPQAVTVNGSAAPQIPMTVSQAAALCTQEQGNSISWVLR